MEKKWILGSRMNQLRIGRRAVRGVGFSKRCNIWILGMVVGKG